MKRFIILFVSLFIFTTVEAQIFGNKKSFLSTETQLDCIFNFADGSYEGDSEEDLKASHKESWNNRWENSVKPFLMDWFVEEANYQLRNRKLKIGNFPDSKYIMVVNVVSLDKDGELDALVEIYYREDYPDGENPLYYGEYNGDGARSERYDNIDAKGFKIVGRKVGLLLHANSSRK